MTDSAIRRPDRLRRCLFLALAAGLATAGCGRDDGDESVRRASTELHTLTGGATTVVPSKNRESTYAKAIEAAKPGVDAGPEASAAALVLTGQAQLGQADQPLGEYARAEREFLNRVTVARSLLAAYIQHSAQAAAARQYDPTNDLAELEKGIAGHADAIAEQQKIKADIDAQIADLESRAKAELDAAGQLDAEVAQLREQATRLTAVQGEPLIRQAAEKRRAADARRMAGLQLQAQIDVTRPRSEEAGLLVDKISNQRRDLEATREELKARDAAAEQLAASAGAAASQSAEKLAAEIAEIAKLRAGAIADAAEEARTRLNTAKSTAQKATSATPAAKTLLGEVNQSLAELAWHRAFGHAGFAQLMETLAASRPALPDQAKYDADAKAAREEEKKALEEAKEAFDAARSAYAGSSAKGDAKDRLDRLANLLEKSSQRAAGDQLDLVGAFAARTPKSGDDAAPPAPDAPAASGDADLTATLETILASARQGQYASVFDHLNADTPEKQQMVASIRETLPGIMRLDAACKEKLGQSYIEASQQAAGGMAGFDGLGAGHVDQLKDLQVADLTVTVNGDTATVAAPGAAESMTFTKVDGRWLMDLPPVDMSDPTMQMGLKMMGAMGPVFDELASEVESGSLQSIQAVNVALMQKLSARPEFQQMMQQMQGGPQ